MIKVGEKVVEITKFPNKESLIRNDFLSHGMHQNIKMKFEGDEDIIHLMMIKQEIDNVGGTASLTMPYVPYSRMDRTEGMNVFTLKAITRFINAMNFTEVIIMEPHSDVCVALLDRVKVVDMSQAIAYKLIMEEKLNKDNTYLVFPDAGAEKRYSKQFKDHDKTITAIKHRNFETGRIEKLELIKKDDVNVNGLAAIIVDDLSSRGGTFDLTAQHLKEMGFSKIYLAVTHCEDTILDGEVLKEGSNIDRVMTTNSIFDENIFSMAKEQFNMKYKKVDLSKLRIVDVF